MAVLAGFVVGEPYALLAFREWSSASAGIVTRIAGAARESFGVAELIARHAVQLTLYGLGPVGVAAAVVGLRRAERVLGLAVAGLALTLPLSRFPMGRYELPLLPFLAVAAGLALARLHPTGRRAALLVALAPPLAYSLAADAALFGAHPYANAGAFIRSRAPQGASVARLWSEYPPLDAQPYPPLTLADPFALQGQAYRALDSDVVVLDDLPLHGWREELQADLAAHYVARRFETSFGLPEPFAPHDSRYPRPRVTVYERRTP